MAKKKASAKKKVSRAPKKTRKTLVPLPKGHSKRPFTLMWVEQAAAERLRAGDLAFSESVEGLGAQALAEAENFETTGATPESADTTITL